MANLGYGAPLNAEFRVVEYAICCAIYSTLKKRNSKKINIFMHR